MTWLAARRARLPASTTRYRHRYGLEEGKKTNAFNIDSIRIYSRPDRPGRLPVAKSAFYENFVWHTDADPFVPRTDVPCLKLLHLASNATAAFDDEIDALVEGLRRWRDRGHPKPVTKISNQKAKLRDGGVEVTHAS